MGIKNLSQRVEEYVSTLDTLIYTRETPRGWVVCGIKNNKVIVKEHKDRLC